MAVQMNNFKSKAIVTFVATSIVATSFVLSERSKKNLIDVDPRLTQLTVCALAFTPTDFAVVDGMRSAEEHAINLKNGVSWVKRSRHQDGCAIDIAAYKDGKISFKPELYYGIVGAFYHCSEKLNIPIVSGGEWKVMDLMHIELPKGTCP